MCWHKQSRTNVLLHRQRLGTIITTILYGHRHIQTDRHARNQIIITFLNFFVIFICRTTFVWLLAIKLSSSGPGPGLVWSKLQLKKRTRAYAIIQLHPPPPPPTTTTPNFSKLIKPSLLSCVLCLVSYVLCPMSYNPCPMSHVLCLMSKSGEDLSKL